MAQPVPKKLYNKNEECLICPPLLLPPDVSKKKRENKNSCRMFSLRMKVKKEKREKHLKREAKKKTATTCLLGAT